MGIFKKKNGGNGVSPIKLIDSEEEKSDAGSLTAPPIKGKKIFTKRYKVLSKFQRLDASSSEESQPFNLEYEPPHLSIERAKSHEPAPVISIFEPTTGKAHNKISIKIKPNKFKRLEDTESSVGQAEYVPPADFFKQFLEKHEVVEEESSFGKEQSSHQSAPEQRAVSVESPKKKLKSFCGFQQLDDFDSPEPVPTASKILKELDEDEDEGFASRDDDFDNLFEAESNEFRQFVFDENFSTIKSVVVEKSDSGAGDADVFRMAAVATVRKLTEDLDSTPAKSAKIAIEGGKEETSSKKLVPIKVEKKPAPQIAAKKTSDLLDEAFEQAKNVKPVTVKKTPVKTPQNGSKSPVLPKELQSTTKKPIDYIFGGQVREGKGAAKEKIEPSVFTCSPTVEKKPVAVKNDTIRAFLLAEEQKKDSLVNEAVALETNKQSAAKMNAIVPAQLKPHAGDTPRRAVAGASKVPLRVQRKFGNVVQDTLKDSPNTVGKSLKSTPRRVRHQRSVSDLSGFSLISNANATVSTSEPDENKPANGDVLQKHSELSEDLDQVFAKLSAATEDLDEVFANIAGVSDDTGSDDPFRIGETDLVDDSAWDIDGDAFQKTAGNDKVKSRPKLRADNDILIDSIRRASSKEPRDPDSGSVKPDPSPRGVRQTLSDGYTHRSKSRREKTDTDEVVEEVIKSLSDSALEKRKKFDAPAPSRSKAKDPTGNDKSKNGKTESTKGKTEAQVSKSRKKAPKSVPENAILASMLFRQTETGNGAEVSASGHKKSKHTEYNDFPEDPNVPPSVHADPSTASIVSSVTEDASSLYQKSSGWSKTANSMLDHYNMIRQKRQPLPPHRPARSTTGSRAGSSVRKGGSTTGRPTWMDRVEEEHMQLFTGK